MDATTQFAAYLVAHCPLIRNVLAPYARDAQDLVTAVPVVAAAIRGYRAAWERHPRFEDCPGAPYDPHVRLVFAHEPGHRQRTHSYLIGPLRDVTAPPSLAWGERSLGQPVAIESIRPDDPVDPYKVLALSWSLRGGGTAYQARQRLKALLPARLHPWISQARRARGRPKLVFLDLDPEILNIPAGIEETILPGAPAYRHLRRRGYSPSQLLPAWFRRATKGELWVRSLPPEARRALAAYIDPLDFWRCATGEVHPDEVERYVHHQLSLIPIDSLEVVA